MADEPTAEVEAQEVETESEGEDQTPEKEVESAPEEVTEEVSQDVPKEGDDEIPVRSTASYIIERQKRTIDKLRNQPENVAEEEAPDPILERLDRIEQLALGQADERDLQEFFAQEPDAKKYEKSIRQYMQHDAYRNASPEVIYHHLSFADAKAQTDSKRKVADLEAKQTKTAGSAVRDTRSSDKKTAQDIKNMSDEEFREFEKEQRRLARS